jgi:hypothetical protein
MHRQRRTGTCPPRPRRAHDAGGYRTAPPRWWSRWRRERQRRRRLRARPGGVPRVAITRLANMVLSGSSAMKVIGKTARAINGSTATSRRVGRSHPSSPKRGPGATGRYSGAETQHERQLRQREPGSRARPGGDPRGGPKPPKSDAECGPVSFPSRPPRAALFRPAPRHGLEGTPAGRAERSRRCRTQPAQSPRRR